MSKKREQDPDLKRRVDQLTQQYQPFNGFERHMIEYLAQCEYRLERYASIERAFIEFCAREIVSRNPGYSMDEAKAAVATGKEHAAKLKLLRRYQTSISKSCRRAVADLEDAIARRKEQHPLEMPNLFQVQ